MIKFTAETKCSGVDLANGTRIRKGAFDAIRKMSEAAGNKYPKEVADHRIGRCFPDGLLGFHQVNNSLNHQEKISWQM